MADIIPYSGPAPYQGTLTEQQYQNPIQQATTFLQNASYTQPTINAYTAPSSSPASINYQTPTTYQSPVPLGPNPVQGPAPVNNTYSPPPAPSDGSAGFDMKYYAGWDPASALADWKATGGSKASGFGATTGYTSPEGNTYGSQEEYNRLIDESYNPQISALNEQANNLNLGQASALEQAQTAFNTQQGLAKNQLTTAQGQLGDVATKGQSAYESALAQARSVYDQLQRGYQQRFGGASSAGAAASEIGNVERLKQQGQSYKQLQDVNRQVELGKQDVQSQYDQNILQLTQNKESAIQSVQNDFRDKLAQINASKGMVESAKAQAKLQALQALRAEVLAVKQQETSFRQQIELQKQQNQMALDTYAKQLAMSQGGTTAKVNPVIEKLRLPITTNLQTNPTNQPLTDQYTGQINPYSKDYLNQGIMTPYMKSKMSELGYTI